MKLKNVLVTAGIATASVVGTTLVGEVASAASLCPVNVGVCKIYAPANPPATNPITVAPILNTGRSIDIDPTTGDLYVLLNAGTPQIFKYTASTNYNLANTYTITGGSAQLRNIGISPIDGSIYLSGSGLVQRYTTSGPTITAAGSTSVSGAGFQRIAFDSAGDVYVVGTNLTSSGVGGVRKLPANLSSNGTTLIGGLGGVRSIEIDRVTSELYLTVGNNVNLYNTAGALTTSSLYTGGIANPFGLALESDGSLAIANNTGSTVKIFDNPSVNACILFSTTVISPTTCPTTNTTAVITSVLGSFQTSVDVANYQNKLFLLDNNTLTGNVHVHVYGYKTVPEADVKLPTAVVLLGLGGGLIWKMKKNQRKNQLSLTQQETTA